MPLLGPPLPLQVGSRTGMTRLREETRGAADFLSEQSVSRVTPVHTSWPDRPVVRNWSRTNCGPGAANTTLC